MKRAIITGATGALGTALIQELICHDIEVLVLCREGSERNNRIPKHPLVTQKFCDLKQLSSLENDTGKTYDVFFHLAWGGTTGAARNDFYLQNRNVQYSLDAIAAASRFGCKRFIGAGSQAEYGRVEGLLKPETPTNPENGYGIAKLCAGHMTREYASQLGMEHIWIRILSIYGPNDNPRSMVSTAIRSLRNAIAPQFTKGEQLWDYLCSTDAAAAFRMAAKRGISGKTYVLGSGDARPLAEYIRIIQAQTNPQCPIDLGAVPYAPKQVMHLQADVSDLKTDTGWYPTTPFTDGILLTLASMPK